MSLAALARRGAALRVGVLGAESTGKTTLVQTLAPALAAATGLQVTAVPEYLRAWCDAQGRTPRQDEQLAIAHQQQRSIEAAAPGADVLLCDTTPLMTAVYSHTVFGDDRVDAFALACQADLDLVLLTALDLPWVADGLQRDGPQVRAPVDACLRRFLRQGTVPWCVVAGSGAARLAAAQSAVTALIQRRVGRPSASAPWRWRCTDCDDAGCEFRLRAAGASGA